MNKIFVLAGGIKPEITEAAKNFGLEVIEAEPIPKIEPHDLILPPAFPRPIDHKEDFGKRRKKGKWLRNWEHK